MYETVSCKHEQTENKLSVLKNVFLKYFKKWSVFGLNIENAKIISSTNESAFQGLN